jgi:UDP-N-acetylglucosamine--N-acetylmuramyl-(pentapeptide) pyrophosphoryl-undecaprenol N-acetylglucosamine transferase
VTGNPIRREFAAQAPAAARFSSRSGPLRVLVMGGSRGAAALNAVVPEAIATIDAPRRPNVTHQTGAGLAAETSARYEKHGLASHVVEFLQESWVAMADADLFIGRSGASTVSELAAIGVPAVFVPYPHHADQQQLHNARVLERVGAAKIVEQAVLTPSRLADIIVGFDRAQLAEMAARATTMAHPNATEKICDQLEAIAVEAKGRA